MVWRSHQRILLIKTVPTRTGQVVTCAGLWGEELRQRPPWPQACCVGEGLGRRAGGMGDTRTAYAAFLETSGRKLAPLKGRSLRLRQLHALRPLRPGGSLSLAELWGGLWRLARLRTTALSAKGWAGHRTARSSAWLSTAVHSSPAASVSVSDASPCRGVTMRGASSAAASHMAPGGLGAEPVGQALRHSGSRVDVGQVLLLRFHSLPSLGRHTTSCIFSGPPAPLCTWGRQPLLHAARVGRGRRGGLGLRSSRGFGLPSALSLGPL